MTEHGSWIRTGTDGDGNCFFNAYVYSLEPTRYKELSYKERLEHVMLVKTYFANRITEMDVIHLIDMTHFELLTNQIEKWIRPRKEPDLSKLPLLSIYDYVELLYKTYPDLKNDTFQEQIKQLYQNYYHSIKRYVNEPGSWMFDSLIQLFMKKMDMNIILVSHDTNKQIDHYPLVETKYTILIYHIHNHFESIGFYHQDTIKRVFEDMKQFP